MGGVRIGCRRDGGGDGLGHLRSMAPIGLVHVHERMDGPWARDRAAGARTRYLLTDTARIGLLLALFVSPFVWALSIDPIVPSWCFAFATLCCALPWLYASRAWRGADSCLAAWLLCGAVSLLWTPTLGWGLMGFAGYAACAVAYLCGRAGLLKPHVFTTAFATVGCVMGGIVVLDWLRLVPWGWIDGISPCGPLANRCWTGCFLAFASAKAGRRAAGFLGVCAVSTLSVSAAIAAAIATPLVGKRWKVLAVTSLLAFAGWLWLSGRQPGSVEGRRVVWTQTVKKWMATQQSIIFGRGLGSCVDVADPRVVGEATVGPGTLRRVYRVHCDPLQVLAETGLIGAAAFLGFLLPRVRERFGAAWLAVALVSFPLHIAGLALPVWCWFGIRERETTCS